MKIKIIAKQMNVYEETKTLIEEKLSKLDRYFDESGEATATLSKKHGVATLEITINEDGTFFRSEVDAESFRDALDKSIDNIERQIRKYKTRLSKRLRVGAFENYPDVSDSEEDDEFIIKKKSFYFKPMSVEEAIMQMNLLGHSFFVFEDAHTGDTCVVYKRKDNAYGLIEPSH